MPVGEFFEYETIVPAFIPVDSQTGANAGIWVNMARYNRLTAVLYKAVGAGTDVPVISMLQATSSAGAGSKALNISRVWKKVGAASVLTVESFTLVTQAAGPTYTATGDAQDSAIYGISIRASDLDVQNGFNWVSMSLADTGSAGAQLAAGFYILSDPRYAGATMGAALT